MGKFVLKDYSLKQNNEEMGSSKLRETCDQRETMKRPDVQSRKTSPSKSNNEETRRSK